MNRFKKRFAFGQRILIMQNEEIDGLKKENQKLKQGKAKLEEKQKEIENERNEWKEERNKLFQEITALKEHIKNFEKADSDENSDIIIEYYMNEDSGE